MALDSTTILDEIRIYIPPENVLSDLEIISLIDLTIMQVGDADSDGPEVKCKSLQAIGKVNLAKATTTTAGVRRERVGDTEKEWFDGSGGRDAWRDFLESLSEVCPLFGYTGITSSGRGRILINPGEAPVINPCKTDYKLGW